MRYGYGKTCLSDRVADRARTDLQKGWWRTLLLCMTMSDSGTSTLSVWSRRILIFGAAVSWLLVMSLPVLALFLAVRGELRWRRGDHALDRVWLVMHHSERGLGWAATRVKSQRNDIVCLTTRVRFWLWQGSVPDLGTSYCECYRNTADPGSDLEYLHECQSS